MVYRETILKCCVTGRVVLSHVLQGFVTCVTCRTRFFHMCYMVVLHVFYKVFSLELQGDSTEMLCDR